MSRHTNSIHTQEKLRTGILNGVNKLSDLVKYTLGARGRNVALPRPLGSAHVTKDGVSVANEVFLKDPLENMWAQTIKEVAKKTNDDAGDGTTTSIVLAQAIINEGIKKVREGYNPMELKTGIDVAVSHICEELNQIAIGINQNSEKIKSIATISANGDIEIGSLIAQAFASVGPEGSIDVQPSKTSKTHVEIVEGMEIITKPSGPYFINTPRQTTEFEHPIIMVANKKLQRVDQVTKVLQAVNDKNRPVVFIADEVINDALAFLTVNATKNRFPFVAINAPSFGQKRKEFLEDICAQTGAQLINEDKGYDYDHITLEGLGTCEKIIVEKNKTTIIRGGGDPSKIANRSEDVRKEIDVEKDKLQIRHLESRLAKLNGSVAVLYVGANSEAEIKEKKDRIEDAIHATKAASKEGIVPGGGVALFMISQNLDIGSISKDVSAGIEIVKYAAQEPIKQILRNAGMDFPRKKSHRFFSEMLNIKIKTKMQHILEEIKRTGKGFDVKTETFCDMIEAGIIDPKKVTRVALENAASVSGLILTTEGAMTSDVTD